jgi:predicted acyltransferase
MELRRVLQVLLPQHGRKDYNKNKSLLRRFLPTSIEMSSEFPKRLVSLDIFRGLTIAAMIVVNNLVAWTDTRRFPRLTHAEWHGCTLADLIFPLFIFIVGVTAAFSLNQRAKGGASMAQLYWHILTRRVALFGLGLIACSYFFCDWLFQAICPPGVTRGSIWAIFLSAPANTEEFYFSLDNLRIMGVLQRIALVYLVVSILLIHTPWRVQALPAPCCYYIGA